MGLYGEEEIDRRGGLGGFEIFDFLFFSGSNGFLVLEKSSKLGEKIGFLIFGEGDELAYDR